jgi:hypothetical protein
MSDEGWREVETRQSCVNRMAFCFLVVNLNFRFVFSRAPITLQQYLETNQNVVRFEVFTAVTTKNVFFCDVTPCGSWKNRRLEGNYHLHHPGDKNQRDRNNVSSN